MRAGADRFGELAGVDRFAREALDIVSGDQAQAAFDLKRESTATRERYGRTSAGQGCLLARRLVEAGVTFVTVLSGGEWDTHRDNFNLLKNVGAADRRALAALFTDLYERGLDRRVLVLVTGEFGRTPGINRDAGRDHWPGAFSVLFSGGGLSVGRVSAPPMSGQCTRRPTPIRRATCSRPSMAFWESTPARSFTTAVAGRCAS